MKVIEIVSLWAVEKKKQVKQSSFSSYILLLENHILPRWGECEVVLEEDVQQWVYDTLERGRLSKKSVGDILICLKMVLRFGAKRGLIEYKGFEIIYPTSSISKSKKLEVLSKANYSKLTEYLYENFTFRNLGLLIALHTGMRIGELSAMKWEDIDVDNGVFVIGKTIQRIYVRDNESGKRYTKLIEDTPKTASSRREIPISKKLLKLIKNIIKVTNEGHYVLSNEKKPIEPRTYRNYYYHILNELEIPPVKFHGLRHTFATYCIESGADIKTTSVLLGHANTSTTLNIYVHPNLDQKRSVINKIFK